MRKRIILLILIFLNLGTIFFFSHQDAVTSTAVSSAVSRQLEIRTPDYEERNQGEKNSLHVRTQKSLRQGAHLLLFFTLSVLFLLFCFTFPMQWYLSVLCTVFFGFLCAIGDEFHQSFVPGRTAQWSDVVHDMQGVVLGVILISLIFGLISTVKKMIQKKRAN